MSTRPASISEFLAERLDSETLLLPVLPAVAMRALQEVYRPECSPLSLGRLIEADPSLAARVLKLANSAAYGGLSPVHRVPFAALRLGSRHIGVLIIGSVAKELLVTNEPLLAELSDRAWSRSLLAAALGARLARGLDVDPAEASSAGLLHAIGIPVLIQLLGEYVAPLGPKRSDELDQAVAAHLGNASRRLLAAWKMPEAIVASLAFLDGHTPNSAYRELARVVRLAAALAEITPPLAVGDLLESPLTEFRSGIPAAQEADALRTLYDDAAREARQLAAVF